ncbi:MAG: dTMP kinase [Desulfomonile sp.]|nr:dTMP kinase [Desulfomonile sp.]
MDRTTPSAWRATKSELSWRRGKLIVFEGIDGSGKTTQARLLAARLSWSRPVLLTAEPSEGPIGRRIRSLQERLDALEEARLFTEDRRFHVEQVIIPALNVGRTVISDRYVYSSVAYQGARGISVADILAWNTAFAVAPDAVVLLELPVASALERIASGRDKPSLFEDHEYLEKVAAIYRSLEDPLIVRIDALGDMEGIHKKIVVALAKMECFQGWFQGQLGEDNLDTT